MQRTESSVRAVERALQILKSFSQTDDSLSLGEISRRADLSKSTTHRLLTSLEVEGFIEQEERNGEYRLGIEMIRLGKLAIENLDLPRIAHSEMEKLAKSTQQTSNLYVVRNFLRLCIAQVSGPDYVRRHSFLGATFPLYCGASGKVMLAYSDEDFLERYFAQTKMEKITKNTIVDRAALEQEFEAIRERGYTYSVAERDLTTASVAVPIFDHTGKVAASLTVSGPAAIFTPENISFYALRLIQSGKKISRRAGFIEPNS